LGYGAMIGKAEFNPLHPDAAKAVNRLRRFHEIVANHSLRYYPTLAINDGFAAYRDLSLRNRSVTHDFLMRSWRLHEELNKIEAEEGFPGVRFVVAAGFRMRGRRAGIDRTSRLFESIMSRYQSGDISAEQAIHQAAAIRQSHDIVPQLQANFAFTKAYLAESGGSKAGLGGPNFYVDAELFDRPLRSWIVSDGEIPWSSSRPQMTGAFYRVTGFPDERHPEGGPYGIRDGLQIAQRLSNDPNVLGALRKARKP
jgi:hypothetical protein